MDLRACFFTIYSNLANIYHTGGDLKMAKVHYNEAVAMAGNEVARNELGNN